MVKNLGIVMLLALLARAMPLFGQVQSLFPKESPPRISVHLSVAKKTFKLGEPIELRVEISNQSNDVLFVGREIALKDPWIYSLWLSVFDAKGQGSKQLVGWGEPFPVGLEESFVDALVKGWIPLPPKYFYGTTVRLDEAGFYFLRKPGHYRIAGGYYSRGMDAPLHYNRLSLSPEEIEKLPYKSWKGEVEANSIWIEIVPRSKGQQKSE
jgi:hypothetical protein